MSQTDAPRISIVVACRNEVGAIRPFLASLLAQDMRGMTWEAIIADGMSGDGTRQVLDGFCSRHPHVSVITNPGMIVSTGLNAAIRVARGEFILRMDAHTRYAPDYCRRCVEALVRSGADNAGGPARTEVTGVLPRAIAAAYHSRFSTGGARFHQDDFEGWVDTVPYGCWRASVFDKLGLFDESLVRNQDDEFNLRLIRAGGRIWQDPAIRSWYSPRPTLRALFRQYFQYGFWKVAVIRKHRLPGSWRHLAPVLFVLGICGLAIVALAAAAGGAMDLSMSAAALCGLIAVVYAGANIAASIVAARSSGLATLPYLPLAFATFHFSYGLGFAAGLGFFSRDGRRAAHDSVFARISR
jgi:glycosyltransferase involved in cell wall biosynthesis